MKKILVALLLVFALLLASALALVAEARAVPQGDSINDVFEFLAKDKTNEGVWSHEHSCSEFTHELYVAAKAEGFEVQPVSIHFASGLFHMMLAFETQEGGILIEPQADTQWEVRSINADRYLCMVGNITCYPSVIEYMDEW